MPVLPSTMKRVQMFTRLNLSRKQASKTYRSFRAKFSGQWMTVFSFIPASAIILYPIRTSTVEIAQITQGNPLGFALGLLLCIVGVIAAVRAFMIACVLITLFGMSLAKNNKPAHHRQRAELGKQPLYKPVS